MDLPVKIISREVGVKIDVVPIEVDVVLVLTPSPRRAPRVDGVYATQRPSSRQPAVQQDIDYSGRAAIELDAMCASLQDQDVARVLVTQPDYIGRQALTGRAGDLVDVFTMLGLGDRRSAQEFFARFAVVPGKNAFGGHSHSLNSSAITAIAASSSLVWCAAEGWTRRRAAHFGTIGKVMA